MVHRCVVCGNSSNYNKDVSYHFFPKDIVKRNLWLSLLNLTTVCRWHKVCSKHFNALDYIFSNDRRILRSTAVPIRIGCSSLDSNFKPEDHNYAQVLPSSPTCLRPSNTAIISEESGNSPSTSKTINYEKINIVQTSQPSAFNLCTDVEVISPPRKVRRIWNPSRIGDLKEEDFLTPKTRKLNLCLVKDTVTRIRRKNKMLNQRNQRLNKKVLSLQNIIKDLKKGV